MGPIRSFEFDLSKDLNVIFGKNNIGKSYAITAIYLILKNLLGEPNRRRHINPFYDFDLWEDVSIGPTKSSQIIKRAEKYLLDVFKKDSSLELDITSIVEETAAALVTDRLLPGLEQSFNNSFSGFDNLSNKFSKEEFSLELISSNVRLSIICNSKKHLEVQKVSLSNRIVLKRITTNRKPRISNGIVTYYYNVKNDSDKHELDYLISLAAIQPINNLSLSVSLLISNVYFLPASRSGLYQALSTFSAVIAELSKSRNFLTRKIELPNISEPVSDYFLYLSNISTSSRKNQSRFAQIATDIEQKILNGRVRFNAESNRIVFYPDKIKTELDLSMTSSMISEIAPIVAYLKYVIKDRPHRKYSQSSLFEEAEPRTNIPSTLIFIEEPEAHLHPVVQVQMMEFFAELSKANIKIVMTSHSNYMFNKLSNLILARRIKYENICSSLMIMETKGSVLDSEAMRAGAEGIVDENFGDTAERLYNERLQIYDDLNT